jgi:mandelate racemase
MTEPELQDTIAHVRLRALDLQLQRPIRVRTTFVPTVSLVLIDLATSDGAIGRSYLHSRPRGPYVELLKALGESIMGQKLAPRVLQRQMLRSFGMFEGMEGLLANAVAGLDMASWDALAQRSSLPLVTLLGGSTEPLPAYNSTGLSFQPTSALTEEARMLVEGGFSGVKMRLGYATLAEDVAAVRAVRGALPDTIDVMADFGQALDRAEAVIRLSALDGEGLAWFEDPLTARDLEGHARLARALKTPIQTGENFGSPEMMAEAIRIHAADCMNLDVKHIGGVSGWLDAAPLAAAAHIPLSSHFYPEYSVHLLAISGSRHRLEYFDWLNPILTDPLRIEAGHAIFRKSPGAGIEWNEDALTRMGAVVLAELE